MTRPAHIDLLQALDRLVDGSEDEAALVLGITNLLAQAAQADLGFLVLPDPDHPRELHLRAASDRLGLLARLGAPAVDALAHQVAQGGGPLLSLTHALDGEPLYIAGLPLRLREGRAGALLLARLARAFTRAEKNLLSVAALQVDNALRAAEVNERLRQETVALRTVLRMDRIRDSSAGLDELLNRGLAELCRAIPAEAGFVMLFDRVGNRLELRAVAGMDAGLQAAGAQAQPLRALYDLADEAIQSGRMVSRAYAGPQASGSLRAAVGIPLILNNRVIGVLGVANPPRRDSFSHADRQLLHAIASQMDTAIFERLQNQRLRETFGRSVGPQVMERLLQIDDRNLLKGERVTIAALFSDIRGFTALSETLDPGVLEVMIDEHLDAMTRVILENEGTLDKFMGDGVMALFNAPEQHGDFARQAVVTALAMQRAHADVMQTWRARGWQARPIGIGVTVGEAMVGNFGSAEHAEYSAIGSSVNLAARLCAVAEGGEVLVDRAVIERLGDQIIASALPPRELKGFAQPVPVWGVTGLRE